MTQPGIEPQSPGPLVNILPNRPLYIYICVCVWMDICVFEYMGIYWSVNVNEILNILIFFI